MLGIGDVEVGMGDTNMFKLFCYLGWHCWHVAPTGMRRYCPNCNTVEKNVNNPDDVISCWRKE